MTEPVGSVPPQTELGAWLARLKPESPEFAVISRAAIFLLALQQRERETFYADLVEALLPPSLELRAVLDIGCGVGNLAIELATRLRTPLTGLDTDPHALRWASRAATGAALEIPVRLDASHFGVGTLTPREAFHFNPVFGDVRHPPFKGGSFDLICLVNILDQLAEPATALAEAANLLAPGGFVLFASPDAWNLRTTARKHWRITQAEWDELFAAHGLATIRQIDDLEWRLKDTPRLHHIYRVHGRLLHRPN